MAWQLTQSGDAVTGSVAIADAFGVIVARGTMSGTLSGSSLSFSITIPAGGFTGDPSCAASATGAASVTPSSLAGSYNGTSCTGAFAAGTLTLSKQ